MAIIVSYTKGDFTPAPEGLHQAVCVDVVDQGMKQTQWGDKHKVQLRWQLDQADEKTGRPFLVMASYTLSLHKKAMLRQHLEAWRGRKFTEEELQGFDLEKLIGVNCQVQIVHNLGDEGQVYANVQAVVPLGKGMTQMRPSADYVRVCDREQKADGGVQRLGDQVIDSTPF